MGGIEPPRRYGRTERIKASIDPQPALTMCTYVCVCVYVCKCSLNALVESNSLQVLHGENSFSFYMEKKSEQILIFSNNVKFGLRCHTINYVVKILIFWPFLASRRK